MVATVVKKKSYHENICLRALIRHKNLQKKVNFAIEKRYVGFFVPMNIKLSHILYNCRRFYFTSLYTSIRQMVDGTCRNLMISILVSYVVGFQARRSVRPCVSFRM